MIKKSGFSLAEVMITIGIIGVVAGMTVPVLISNTNGAKFRNQFKKTVSSLNQAGLMAQAQYEYNFAGAEDKCPDSVEQAAAQHPEDVMTFCSILNGTLQSKTYHGKVTNLKRNAKKEEVPYKHETRDTIPDN